MDEVISGVRSAIASGAGNEILQPLAIVVLGGLFTSTALTLLVLLALYAKFGKRLMSKQKTIAVKTSFPVNATPQSSVDSPM
ncbi:MAG: efflux RND transporter permease subunit [Coleofasciculus sp. G1-WW12-02]